MNFKMKIFISKFVVGNTLFKVPLICISCSLTLELTLDSSVCVYVYVPHGEVSCHSFI